MKMRKRLKTYSKEALVSKVLVVFWALALASLLALLAMGAQGDVIHDELNWAMTECGQGNTDACQLERNLLSRR